MGAPLAKRNLDVGVSASPIRFNWLRREGFRVRPARVRTPAEAILRITMVYIYSVIFMKILKSGKIFFIFSFIYLGETLQQPLVINNHNYSANDVEVNDEQDL